MRNDPALQRSASRLLVLSAVVALATGCASAKMAPGEAAAPAAPASASSAPAAAAAAGGSSMSSDVMTRYTVVEGDHLWGISSQGAVYGDPYQWPLIYKANTDDIEDADLIFPEQVLVIPRNMSNSEIDAAIMHAKTRGAWSLGQVEDSDLSYLQQ